MKLKIIKNINIKKVEHVFNMLLLSLELSCYGYILYKIISLGPSNLFGTIKESLNLKGVIEGAKDYFESMVSIFEPSEETQKDLHLFEQSQKEIGMGSPEEEKLQLDKDLLEDKREINKMILDDRLKSDNKAFYHLLAKIGIICVIAIGGGVCFYYFYRSGGGDGGGDTTVLTHMKEMTKIILDGQQAVIDSTKETAVNSEISARLAGKNSLDATMKAASEEFKVELTGKEVPASQITNNVRDDEII